MNLDFTSEQDILRDSARKFLSKECPYARVKELEESEAGYDARLWAKMAELGWLGWLFPEAYGGFDGEFTDLVIIQEEIGRAAYPSPFFSTVIQSGLVILEGGSEDQKTELLSGIAEGGLLMALAQYEEEASYLASGIQMKAVLQDGAWVLNGTKLFVLDANVADKLLVVARAGDQGPTLFLVDAKDPGLTITKMPAIGKDNNCEVVFQDVKTAESDVIGPVGGAWEILEKMNVKASVAKAAEMVGGCKVCIDITAAYAKEREQYGHPIGGYQAIQHYMANMLLAHDTANAFLYKVASMIDEGADASTEASVVKACANENFKFVSERAVQIHGGIGTTREGDIGLFYRRAKAFEYVSGDTDHHYEKVAQALLD
ncbi:MAG: acyl-CoA/acyl-ACP dehydrogenase [Proteobacteria bacterium]|nr:acyl-CoA/acyl-ACP dehydrogenase [Pseudomonadota bacterium]